jgi:hypothetical protein
MTRRLPSIFVALALSVCLFFLLLPEAMVMVARNTDGNLVFTRLLPKDGNCMSLYLFSFRSHHPLLENDVSAPFPNWKSRIAGPALSGWCWDRLYAWGNVDGPADFSNYHFSFTGYAVLFAAFNALWVGATFALLIAWDKLSLLTILGTFAGLMYNFIIPAGKWFYPWDYASMFFFTWACLLFIRKECWPVLLIAFIGSLFKESLGIVALLAFFFAGWSWRRRLLAFAGTAAACWLGRHALMAAYGVTTPAFAPEHWFAANLHNLFSLHLNHMLFANAGALVLMFLVPGRQWLPLKLLAGVFVLGQFLYGVTEEFRIWYELLPLGWIMVGSWWLATISQPLNPKPQRSA